MNGICRTSPFNDGDMAAFCAIASRVTHSAIRVEAYDAANWVMRSGSQSRTDKTGEEAGRHPVYC
jgi:hypothetical protein